MSEGLQTLLILIVTLVAIGYLIRKFVWKPKKQHASKSCGKDGCGCS